MRLEIRGTNFALTPAIREHADRKLRAALNRFETRVSLVSVRVGDLNGPRGGADNICRVSISCESLSPILIEDVGDDLYAAISRAADRAGHAISRSFARAQSERRAWSLR